MGVEHVKYINRKWIHGFMVKHLPNLYLATAFHTNYLMLTAVGSQHFKSTELKCMVSSANKGSKKDGRAAWEIKASFQGILHNILTCISGSLHAANHAVAGIP